MNSHVEPLEVQEPLISKLKSHRLFWFFCAFCLFVLFYDLGGAALFEPDEGRNAEKAREILLLNDWVTPHENFVPVLDKPIFFYWLIALSYKLFGVSEWAARLPSVLAAVGCIAVVYQFSRIQLGAWEGLWSALLLVTGIEFFLFSRIVILDMTFTFFVTLALHSFYSAANVKEELKPKTQCFFMYLALAAGTLIKGLIGLILPGMVFFFYLLLAKKWSSLRRMYLVPGVLFYLAIVAPWYLWSNARNPGYLQYYFWDEHFARYLTDEFSRSKDWYYFLLVLAVGFLPWAVLLPLSVRSLSRKFDDKSLFLSLWASLPLVFFSLSRSKLPQYILPIFPALAILTARAVVDLFEDETRNGRRWLYWPLFLCAVMTLYLFLGSVWPQILAEEIRVVVGENERFIAACAALLLILCLMLPLGNARGRMNSQSAIYLCSCVGFGVFLLLIGHLMDGAAPHRSSRTLARYIATHFNSETQLVLYDTYPTGLIFYLRLNRPIWVVAREGKTNLLGSAYVSAHLPDSASGYGKVLFDFDEFRDAWKNSEKSLRVVVKAKNVHRLEANVGAKIREIVRFNEYALVAKL